MGKKIAIYDWVAVKDGQERKGVLRVDPDAEELHHYIRAQRFLQQKLGVPQRNYFNRNKLKDWFDMSLRNPDDFQIKSSRQRLQEFLEEE